MSEQKRRLTPKEWAKAEAFYESGDYSLDDISAEFGVHKITVQRHMKKNGVKKGSRAEEVKNQVNEAMAKTIEDEVSILSTRIKETKEEHYRLNQAIDKRIAREIVASESDKRPIATAAANIKTLKIIAETLKITRGNRYEILGITETDVNDDELPDLEVREMLDSEVKEIRDAQEEADKAMSSGD